MKERRRNEKLRKAAMAKHRAGQVSRIKRVRIAREVVRRKMREAGLPNPSPRKMKKLVARCLAATGDPKPAPRRMSLGQGLQQIKDRMGNNTLDSSVT